MRPTMSAIEQLVHALAMLIVSKSDIALARGLLVKTVAPSSSNRTGRLACTGYSSDVRRPFEAVVERPLAQTAASG